VFLDQPEIFGDLGEHPRFRAAFVAARAKLAGVGARAAMAGLA
jgi:mannitol 2-dehydrogenase